MSPANVLVVEDERIVARDIQATLRRLGYVADHAAATAEEALRLVETTAPDLVLLDIRLRGGPDGIEVARRLAETWGGPVVFLTAYSDEETLARAKRAGPYGFIVKPFDDRDLRTGIEIALAKHALQAELARERRLLEAMLRGMADGVIGVDGRGDVAFLNARAEAMLGAREHDARGRPVAEVLRDRDDVAGKAPLARALAGVGRPQEKETIRTVIDAPGGRATPVVADVTTLGDGGRLAVLHDLTLPEELERLAREHASLREEFRRRLSDIV